MRAPALAKTNCFTRSCTGRRTRFAVRWSCSPSNCGIGAGSSAISGFTSRPAASYFWPALQQVSATREPFVIPDITKHSLFGFGLQAPALAVRAFATIPLITPAGRLVGAISLLDLQPQTLTASQLDLLLSAGRRIAEELAKHYRDELAETDDAATWRSREQWAALERLALTDRVTGLFNRHAGELALEREVARARRTSAPFSLALIDVDRFKLVNDRHGHAAGDEVLKQVSSILTSTFRASDLAVRWGGDEFLVFLPDVPVGGAMVFAERARSQIEALVLSTASAPSRCRQGSFSCDPTKMRGPPFGEPMRSCMRPNARAGTSFKMAAAPS